MNMNQSKDILRDAIVTPEGSLELLSQAEVNQLLDASQGGLYELYRRCSLAVLNWGSHLDDTRQVLEQFRDFSYVVGLGVGHNDEIKPSDPPVLEVRLHSLPRLATSSIHQQ